MADVNAAEVETKAEAAFGLGFGDTPPAETLPAKVVDEPAAEPAKPVVVAPVPPEKPRYVKLTEQEWNNTKAAAGKVATLESQVAKLAGSIPKAEQIIQQAVERVQSQTPAGVSVEFSDEDFAELAADFPEIAKMTRASFERVFKKANVRGTGAPNGVAPDPDAIDKAVDARLKARDEAAVAATREKEMTTLLEVYPDWEKIVGRPLPGSTVTADTEWRKWATTNDVSALSTWSAAELQASIAKFTASQKPSTPAKPDKAAVRRAVIADAETPRAEGNPPPLNQPVSAEEAFGSGFKAARRH